MSTPQYTRNAGRAAAIERAVDAALVAAAQVVQNDVRLRFKARNGGYTSGAFAHPGRGVSATITKSDPHTVGAFRRVLIGTNARSPDGFSYPLAWEMGHYNVFTNQFKRVETFRPALFDNAQRAGQAFIRVMRRMVGT